MKQNRCVDKRCQEKHCKQRFICQADQSRDSFLRGGRNIGGSWRVSLVAPRIVNDSSQVRRGSSIRFILRGRGNICMVKVDCDFSWQAQHFVTFWEIAGARNSWTISLFGYWRKQFNNFSLKS